MLPAGLVGINISLSSVLAVIVRRYEFGTELPTFIHIIRRRGCIEVQAQCVDSEIGTTSHAHETFCFGCAEPEGVRLLFSATRRYTSPDGATQSPSNTQVIMVSGGFQWE